VALWALVLGAPLWAQDAAEVEAEQTLRTDLVTPHTDWATPYPYGKTRVLFFTDGRGTNPRECVELCQRFDLDMAAVFWAQIVDTTISRWHGAEVGERRMLGLLDQKWDCYVFLGIPLTNLNAEQQYKVLRPVSEGAGLVVTGIDDKRLFTKARQITPLPPFLASGPVGDAFQIGKGRGMRLPRRPDIGYYPGWEVDYDYWAERLGRAILWAAGKEPKMQLELKVPPEISLQGAGTGDDAPQLTYRLTHAEGAGELRAEIRFRKPGRPPIVQTRTLAAASDEVHSEPIPLVQGAGSYHADVRILSARGVEAWATVPFKVTSTVTIPRVTLTRDWGEPGDRIAGQVELEGDPPAAARLQVSLYDARNRELVRTQATPAARVPLDLPVEPWMPLLLRVEAVLFSPDSGREIASNYAYFRVTHRNRGQFNFLMWDYPTGSLAPYAQEVLARTGVTITLSGNPNPPLYVAANNMAYVPYTTRILAQLTPEGIMKPFCWNDEVAVQKHVTDLAQRYQPARGHGVFVYSLGDEVDTQGSCLSPDCARAYRRFLQDSYGTLDALNASWGTAFKSWDEVGLSSAQDNEEAESLRAKNYPRWFDRQAFQSANFVEFCGKYARAFEALDPQARTGFEGAGRFEGGDDLDLIIRKNQFWSPYPGQADEVIRSLAPRDFPRANWMGYTKDADSLLAQYWRMVTRGMDAVWWWRWDGIGRFHGWLAPDLQPYPATEEIVRDTQVMRDGLGDLLLQSRMQDDGIAMLYSYPSTFAHKLEEGASFGSYESAHLAMQAAVRDNGLQYRYVSDRMLRNGEFDAARTRVLLLPRAEALGDAEAEAIRKFVEAGGTVIADVRPGIYDGHCKPRKAGVLDDLFGIKRGASVKATAAAIASLGISGAMVDTAVSVTDGQAQESAAGAPVIISRSVGKGRTLLLNFTGGAKGTGGRGGASVAEPGLRALIFSALTRAGVKPALTVTWEDGKPAAGLEVVRWRNRGIELVALFEMRGDAPRTAAVELAGPYQVYDLRQRKDLGRCQRFQTTVIPCRATFFALCSRPAPQATVQLASPSAQRGELVKGTVSVPNAEGLHALRLRVTAGGQPAEWFDRNLLVGTEPVSFVLPLALNDAQGAYDVSVIDLFTNRAVGARLEVH
jgi:beta-galactosidase